MLANFSISQFKEHVQLFIKENGIDANGNNVIEKDNGELAKVLNHFGLEESKLGDLLEKTDNAVKNSEMAVSSRQPSEDDVYKDFIQSYKKYNNLSEAQQEDVRKKVCQSASESYSKMTDEINNKPLYSSVSSNDNLVDFLNTYDDSTDAAEFKQKFTQKLLDFSQKQCEQLKDNIKRYDAAFGEYDVTYSSPFKIKSGVPNLPKDIAEACLLAVSAKINEYSAKDTSSLTHKENLELSLNLYNEVNEIINKFTNSIESKKEEIVDAYEAGYRYDTENLMSENPRCETWDAPLGGGEASFEYIIMTSAPVQKTFTDVVESTTTGVSTTEIDNKNNPNAPIYDLSGRQVSKESLNHGQIYIQNGKKFVAQ